MNVRVVYNDKWLRIVGYPVLAFITRHFGEYESIGTLMKTRLYYGDLLWNTLIVAVTWEVNRRLIIYLDNRFPWVSNKFKRFVIQLSLAVVISVPLVASMIYLWNEVIIHRPNNFNTAYLLVYDFPLTLVFTAIVHMIYVGMYFHQYYTATIQQLRYRIAELENAESPRIKEATSPYRNLLIVNYGSSSVPVAVENVSYIYKMNEVSFVKTQDGKEYTSSSSLDNLEQLLHPEMFFRLSRQMLGNVNAIRKFRQDASGRLILEMYPPTDEEVSVSRKKAAEFKEWVGRRV